MTLTGWLIALFVLIFILGSQFPVSSPQVNWATGWIMGAFAMYLIGRVLKELGYELHP